MIDTHPALSRALAERDYKTLTPVQSAVLVPEAEGRDMLVSAQTGSGKTVAYGLAMAKGLLGEAETLARANAPLALIVAPTRELAMQVERELAWLYLHAKARIVACVGGMDARAERRKLADGAHIIVGTPGRLRDHIERGDLKLHALQVVVLDEADEMFALGFREDLEFILDATPEGRRTLLFSATMPKGIITLAKRYQANALRVEVANTEGGHADIDYRAIRVAPKEVEHAVVNLLRFVEATTAIVFCNTREAVRHLQATLLERGFSAVQLSGELSQHERNQAMQALRDGRARVCVATDVAARGIDLPNLGLVIHAELPHDAEVLQHRSGRTGRAGRKGVSALIVPPARRRRAEQLLRDAGVDVSWAGPPTADAIRALDQQRLLDDPLLNMQGEEDDAAMAAPLLAAKTPTELALALVRLYRARLPAIEEVSDPGNGPEIRAPRGAHGAPLRQSNAPWADISGSAVWFRLDIGRKKNADPKWLLPMLCRKGGVTRADIGAIRIFDHETKVEIAGSVASEFQRAMSRESGEAIGIERLIGGGERAPEHQDKPRRDKPKYDKPRSEKPEGKAWAPRLYDKPLEAAPVKSARAPQADAKPGHAPRPARAEKPAWKKDGPKPFAKEGNGEKPRGKPAYRDRQKPRG